MYEYVHGLDQGFPCPDPVLDSLERFYDAGNPLHSGGYVKAHGAYPRPHVGFVLGMLVLVFMSLTGLLVGVLTNQPFCSRLRHNCL
jgi:hypothetical protein